MIWLKFKLKSITICTIALMLASSTGCSKNESATIIEIKENEDLNYFEVDLSKITTEQVTEATTEQIENYEGKAISKLTGEWIDEEIAKNRPIAVMLNNIKQACPQAGISKAGIVYECLVEGGITRLMGIFEDYKSLDKIGSMRSARPYYVRIANEYDAIFVHYGHTKYALNVINDLGVDNLSGLTGYGEVMFYRTSDRVSPHNAYTSYDGITKGINYYGYRTKYDEDYKGHFEFSEDEIEFNNDNNAVKVTLPFSKYTQPWFEYNQDDKLYYRFQFGDKQIEELTGNQLTYKNIIIQFVNEWVLDAKDYQDMDLIGSGNGYYITNGKYQKITWKKSSYNNITEYYDESGNKILLNTGKTYIGIMPNTVNAIFE